MTNINHENNYDVATNVPTIDNPRSITDELRYIGDDGKLYSTPEALEGANKTYWENWKKTNDGGGVQDLSHLKALDGSYHSNPESIKEANRKFRETYAEQTNNINVQRSELLHQLLANPKYALDCAGLKFVKQIYQIDPQLTQKILELIMDATKDGRFENLETKFIDMVSTLANIQQTNGRSR